MGEPSIDSLHDTYEDQLSAARFKAERDAAMQELQAMRERNIELWMESGMANELATCAEEKAERLGKLVWRLQNRLARAHRREKALRKGMRMWREKAISGPVRTVSAYDLLPEADLETLRWVREQGGLDALKAYTDCFSNLLRECHGYRDLAREYEKRIMPEGYEWPRWDDNEPITYTDSPEDVCGIFFALDASCYALMRDVPDDALETGERVKRPAVLASDGESLEVGQTVWNIDNGMEFTVIRLPKPGEYQAVEVRHRNGSSTSYDPCQLTHRRPVLDAFGAPIKVGDTVYEVGKNYPPFIVGRLPEPGAYRSVRVVYPSGASTYLDPERLTHTKPEIDTWQRIEEDLGDEMAKQQCGPISPELACKLAGEFVRRCRALAERGE